MTQRNPLLPRFEKKGSGLRFPAPVLILLIALLTSCAANPGGTATPVAHQPDPYQPVPYVKLKHPEWSKNATIYQINTRQFTPEGTFRAAELQLPRLKELGVDILWLMPIHKIGEKNRKGTLGSPYAVQDYYSVNSEFGTLDDLKHFVEAAHQQHMYVILDWVANHTAWDNVLVREHPDASTPNGTRATGKAVSRRRPGWIGPTSSISTTATQVCAST